MNAGWGASQTLEPLYKIARGAATSCGGYLEKYSELWKLWYFKLVSRHYKLQVCKWRPFEHNREINFNGFAIGVGHIRKMREGGG